MAKIKRSGSDSHHNRPKGITKGNFEKVYWPYIPVVIGVSFLLMLSSMSGSLKAAIHHPMGRVLSYATSMSLGGLLADTNAARESNGVADLTLNDKLDAAAQANADDMAARNYWSHYTPEGNPPWIWVTNQGYAYQALGQNLAAGFSDEQSTINGWMASPPHRENMLNSTYTEVGFGYANNPNYTSAGGGPMTIVVAFYGQPAAPSTVQPQSTAPPSSQSTVQSSSTSGTPPPSSSAPAAASPDQSTSPSSKSTPLPATTSTPKSKIPASQTTSRLQLAAPKASYGPLATRLSLILGLGLAIFWASRHLRALRRLFLEGERYAIRHPLTDIGLAMIAGLLFILSQTAGIIQ